jgi:fatty acid desaturase
VSSGEAAPAARGEEFRDDVRRGLPPHVVKRLTVISPLKSTLAILHTVGVLAACLAAALAWWHPLVIVPALILIASRQQAFFVLAHDAAHYRLYNQRWLNDLIGRACGTVVGISMPTYRVVHRLHHNHLYGPQDPDIPLHGGYPRGAAYLAKKLARDLLGLTAWKTYAYFFGAPVLNVETQASNRPLDDTSPRLRQAARRDRWIVAGFHGVVPVAAFAAGYGVEYLVLWVLPLVTLLQVILRFRAICEHGAVTDLSTPLTAARTNLGPAWLRWYLFPHHVNYHIEHHLYPAIPHYNLPECHAALREAGLLEDAEVVPIGETTRRIFAPKPAAAVAI